MRNVKYDEENSQWVFEDGSPIDPDQFYEVTFAGETNPIPRICKLKGHSLICENGYPRSMNTWANFKKYDPDWSDV